MAVGAVSAVGAAAVAVLAVAALAVAAVALEAGAVVGTLDHLHLLVAMGSVVVETVTAVGLVADLANAPDHGRYHFSFILSTLY